MVYLLLVFGLIILVAGAELLVRGAVSLAELARISPLVIGLTVVAFGTSAPELAVSSISSLKGESEIALGNVLGSNVFNVLFILGLSAIIMPLSVSSQLVRLDVPLMVAASIGVAIVATSGSIGRVAGVLMSLCFVGYTAWLIQAGRKESDSLDESVDSDSEPVVARSTLSQSPGNRIIIHSGFLLGGLILLVLGAKLLVDSATIIARDFGVSDVIIGLTIVAAGTSLPELATSVVAAMKGQRDIAVGNVVGSNIFNLLVVLSAASIFSKSGVSVSRSVWSFDIAFMVGVAILCWPIFVSRSVVSRWEGAFLLSLYLAYTGLLVADSMQTTWATSGKTILISVVMPASIVTVGVLALLKRDDEIGESRTNTD